MDRKEYLRQLKLYLQGFPQDEIEDILFDYEEHFDIGITKGKSEEEISKELGDPRDIARKFKSSSNFKNHKDENQNYDSYDNDNNYDKSSSSNDTSRKILLTILLLFFNLVIVLGPFLGIVGLLFGGYVIGASFIISSFFILFGGPISFFMTASSPHILTSLSFSIGFMALGILEILLFIYLSKLFIKYSAIYLGWNIRLINGEEARI